MSQWFASIMEQMMDFSNILNASIAASWMVLAVIVLRFLLNNAPKWSHVALWGLVALRLLLPFSIESNFSLIPSTETVPQEILRYQGTLLHNPAYLDVVSNPNFPGSVSIPAGHSVDYVQWQMVDMTFIWLAGIAALLLYTAVSYLSLRRKLATAVILRENIFRSENVGSPFVLGIIKPRIYLPYHMEQETLRHVIAHEQAHIRRRDHWWKPLGFLLLTIHWFNPVMWLAYVLLCRDIELACDESVIKGLGYEQRADYTQALVTCSINRRTIAACPLAFGEVGVKERVKSVMNYKEPTFWVVALAVVACVVVAVCFLTNPASVNEKLSIFIDCQIAEHHQNEQTRGRASCVNWEVLGMEKRGATATVYLWVLYEEYSMQNNALHLETGSHIPTIITAGLETGAYKLIEYWEPRDGGYLKTDIQERFPLYLQMKALDSQRFIKSQQAENKRMAWEYFQSIPNADDVNSAALTTDVLSQLYPDAEIHFSHFYGEGAAAVVIYEQQGMYFVDTVKHDSLEPEREWNLAHPPLYITQPDSETLRIVGVEILPWTSEVLSTDFPNELLIRWTPETGFERSYEQHWASAEQSHTYGEGNGDGIYAVLHEISMDENGISFSFGPGTEPEQKESFYAAIARAPRSMFSFDGQQGKLVLYDVRAALDDRHDLTDIQVYQEGNDTVIYFKWQKSFQHYTLNTTYKNDVDPVLTLQLM